MAGCWQDLFPAYVFLSGLRPRVRPSHRCWLTWRQGRRPPPTRPWPPSSPVTASSSSAAPRAGRGHQRRRGRRGGGGGTCSRAGQAVASSPWHLPSSVTKSQAPPYLARALGGWGVGGADSLVVAAIEVLPSEVAGRVSPHAAQEDHQGQGRHQGGQGDHGAGVKWRVSQTSPAAANSTP